MRSWASQYPVEFDGNEAAGTPGEQGGEHAAAGTDLEDGALRDVAQCFDDAQGRRLVGKEVLSEFRLPFSFCALRYDLWHVDPLSRAQID